MDGLQQQKATSESFPVTQKQESEGMGHKLAETGQMMGNIQPDLSEYITFYDL